MMHYIMVVQYTCKVVLIITVPIPHLLTVYLKAILQVLMVVLLTGMKVQLKVMYIIPNS